MCKYSKNVECKLCGTRYVQVLFLLQLKIQEILRYISDRIACLLLRYATIDYLYHMHMSVSHE